MVCTSATSCKMYDHRQYDYDCGHRVTKEIVRCQGVINETGSVAVQESECQIMTPQMGIAQRAVIRHLRPPNVMINMQNEWVYRFLIAMQTTGKGVKTYSVKRLRGFEIEMTGRDYFVAETFRALV